MRKEVIIAVFAGIIFGAIIAFGVWRANIAFNPQDLSTDSKSDETAETDNNGNSVDLAISEPLDKSVFTNSEVSIVGLTKPNNLVVISSEDEDYIFKAEPDGSFNQSIELDNGINQIIIASINETGTKNENELIVIYSSEFENEE